MSLRSRSVALGSGAGVAAFVVGSVVTYLAAASTVRSSTARQLFEALGGDLPTWKVVGWVFFNAHGVATRIPGLLSAGTVDLIARADAFPVLLYVVPPVTLLAAGVVAGMRTEARDAVAGLVGGYLVLTALAVAVVGVTVGETTVGPVLLPALALAGICYPLLFGGLGVVAGTGLTD